MECQLLVAIMALCLIILDTHKLGRYLYRSRFVKMKRAGVIGGHRQNGSHDPQLIGVERWGGEIKFGQNDGIVGIAVVEISENSNHFGIR